MCSMFVWLWSQLQTNPNKASVISCSLSLQFPAVDCKVMLTALVEKVVKKVRCSSTQTLYYFLLVL